MSKLSPHAFLKNSALTKKILSNSAQICIKEYALKNASKYPKSNIRLFLLSTFLCTMGFLRFLALKMLKSQKKAVSQVLYHFKHFKYPKIAIFKFTNITISEIRVLWEHTNAPKPIFGPKSKLGGHHTYVTGIYIKSKHW